MKAFTHAADTGAYVEGCCGSVIIVLSHVVRQCDINISELIQQLLRSKVTYS